MNDLRTYVERLFKKQPHQRDTIEHIIEMLEEKVEDLIERGIEEEAAIHQTILEFGDYDDYYIPSLEWEKRRYKYLKTLEHYRNDLLFSILSTVILIGMLVALNVLYLDQFGPWSVFPSLGLLFWPLSILYKWLNRRGGS